MQGKIWDCIYASRKAAQGWIWFTSAPSRLGAILGRSQGLLRYVDVEGVAWEVMCKHNKSEFQRGLMYLLRLVFPQKNYWFSRGYFLLTPISVKDMHPELCGGFHRRWCGGHHGTWEAGQRIINAWVFNP